MIGFIRFAGEEGVGVAPIANRPGGVKIATSTGWAEVDGVSVSSL